MSLREEIEDILQYIFKKTTVFTEEQQNKLASEYTDIVISHIEKRIDEMMITQLSTNDEIAENIFHNEVLEKVKEILK